MTYIVCLHYNKHSECSLWSLVYTGFFLGQLSYRNPITVYQILDLDLAQTAKASYQLWLNFRMSFCTERELWILSHISYPGSEL